ncbi:MAG TPA: hypothetical protein VMH41_12735 [Mycobacteriales bacterium]|nr:hypothetical protein [Mycobacteriales bacterium]
MTTAATDLPPSLDTVRWLVEQACRAPSVLNSQPWRFTYTGEAIELWADTSRGLTFADPEGRELALSCGAALFNLRVAIRSLGLTPDVRLLPDPDGPRLLAQISLLPGQAADPDEAAALSALARRHTRRSGFDDKPISPELGVYLQRAADAEGALLFHVNEPGMRRRLLQLARTAEREIAGDPRAQAELERWTPEPGSGQRDGVPATAYPARPQLVGDALAARDLDRGRGIGSADPDGGLPESISVIVTPTDVQADWLVAGQAMERVLVRAAQDWAFAAIDSQMVELPHIRAELRRALGVSGFPQIILRLGHAGSAPSTPRRPVDDVLEFAQH